MSIDRVLRQLSSQILQLLMIRILEKTSSLHFIGLSRMSSTTNPGYYWSTSFSETNETLFLKSITIIFSVWCFAPRTGNRSNPWSEQSIIFTNLTYYKINCVLRNTVNKWKKEEQNEHENHKFSHIRIWLVGTNNSWH